MSHWLHDYGQNCKMCAHLVYDLIDECTYLKKLKIQFKKQMSLSTMPPTLLNSILEKMNYAAFQRFRRTNKEYLNYIGAHREKLKIAMFHDKSFKLFMIPKNDDRTNMVPCVKLNCRYFWTRSWDWDDKEMDCELGMRDFHIPEPYSTVRGFRREIFLYLDEFDSNPELKKELIGFYQPFDVSLRGMKSEDWAIHSSTYLKFLKWANVTAEHLGISFIATDLAPGTMLDICNLIHPRTMWVILDNPPQRFLSNDCFKKAKHVVMNIRDFEPDSLRNFEVIESRPYEWLTPSYFDDLLRVWIRCTLKAKKIDVLAKDIFPVFETLCREKLIKLLPQKDSWNYMKAKFKSYEKFKQETNLSVYLIEQQISGRKAICITEKRTYPIEGHSVELREVEN